jgi:hypothetical protein
MIAVNYIWKHSVFAYPKRERYYNSRLCFEIARQFWLSTELCWQWDLARHFKTEPIETVVFSFGIGENIVFSNVIDSYHLVDERYQLSWKCCRWAAKKEIFVAERLPRFFCLRQSIDRRPNQNVASSQNCNRTYKL